MLPSSSPHTLYCHCTPCTPQQLALDFFLTWQIDGWWDGLGYKQSYQSYMQPLLAFGMLKGFSHQSFLDCLDTFFFVCLLSPFSTTPTRASALHRGLQLAQMFQIQHEGAKSLIVTQNTLFSPILIMLIF